MIIDSKRFKEIARGISDSTWEKFNTLERQAYVKNHPHSRFANPDDTLPTQIKNPVNNRKKDYSDLRNPFILPNGRKSNKTYGDIINECVDIIEDFDNENGTNFADKLQETKLPWNKMSAVDFICVPLNRDETRDTEEGEDLLGELCFHLKDKYGLDFDYNNNDRYDELYFFACDEHGNVLNWEDENRPCNLYGIYPWEKPMKK